MEVVLGDPRSTLTEWAVCGCVEVQVPSAEAYHPYVELRFYFEPTKFADVVQNP